MAMPISVAEKCLEDELFDGIGIGHAILADPDYVNKVKQGKFDDIRPCIACHNGCFVTIFVGKPMPAR